MPVSPCAKDKIRNPATGRCVYKDSPVLKKQIKYIKKVPTVKIVPTGPIGPIGPIGPVGPNKRILVKCDVNKYINPKTKRCVQFKNKDIQKYLLNGYILSDGPVGPVGPIGPVGPLIKPTPFNKVNINNPNNIKNKDVKVLVPPNPQETVKLIYCGPGKVINPITGKCVLLSSPIGKRLTSVPYIIVNPPSKPQKTPQFILQCLNHKRVLMNKSLFLKKNLNLLKLH